MNATLKEIAELAGVSISSASRTFTAGASVSQKTRRRVERAARQLGYRPNYLAKGLLKQQTKLIGLISNDFENPAFLQISNLFSEELQRRGYRPLLLNLSAELSAENAVQMLQQYAVDGAIIASLSLPEKFGAVFSDSGMPVVRAFGQCTSLPKVHSVGVDYAKCGSMAAEYLISKGYVHIAFMGGADDDPRMHNLLEGFLTAINRNPRIRFSYSFSKETSCEAGEKEMKRLLLLDRAEAYFCADDILAIGALNAIKSEKLSVPKDVGVLGINDIDIAGWGLVNLSTIRLPSSNIVSSAIELVTDIIESESRLPETRLFSCEIIERGSIRN